MMIPIVVGVLGKVPKDLGRRLEELEISDYRIVEINQYTEKSLGDLKRLAFILTPVKALSANAGEE